MIEHLSPSQIGMFLRCPKQWEYRYVQGIKIPPTGAMVLGSAYHKGVAERFLYVIDKGEQPPPELATDIFETEWSYLLSQRSLVEDEGEQLSFDEIEWGADDPGRLKQAGLNLIHRYDEAIAPAITPVSVESKQTMYVESIPIVLVTDLVTPYATIDHKVKKKRFSEAELQQNIQGTVYQMATGLPLEFHVSLNQKALAFDIQYTTRTAADERWFVGQAELVWQAIHAGVFVPNDQGWHCSEDWCGYWCICKGRR